MSKTLGDRGYKTMARGLASDRAMLESIHRSAPVGIGVVADRVLLQVNQRMCEMTGYSPEELLNQGARMLYPSAEEYEAVGLVKYQQIREQGRGEVETRWRRKDGTLVDVLLVSVPLEPADIRDYTVFTALDITERKRAEGILRESEERLRSIVDKSLVGVAIIDDETRYTFVNEKFAAITGYSEHELLGREFDFLLTDESRRLATDRYWRRQSGEEVPDHYELVLLRKDGDLRNIEIRVAVFKDAEGRIKTLIQILDITERKRVERALLESEHKYRSLFELAGEAILVAQDGRLKLFNGAASTLAGYSAVELLERTFADLIHPEDRAMVMERHLLRMRGGEPPGTYPFRIIQRNGEVIWVELTADLIEWEGRPATLNFLTDITGRKRMEQEREQLQAQLAQAQKMESVGRLAGGVAHDFNNMLGVILAHTELALEGLGAEAQLRADLEEIREAARRSADLTRQLLAFARKQTVAPHVLDLNETVEGMLRMLRRLIGEDIRLSWKPSPELWQVRIDPTQVDQILANLCVNARDAIEGVGSVSIETRHETVAEGAGEVEAGDYVVLSVSDDGCGMGPDIMVNLFEPFFTTKEIGKGTGLGLSTVYGMVRQNRGHVRVRSEPGTGSSFDVLLPRYAGRGDIGAGERLTATGTKSHGGKTVLVVEDEKSILKVAERVLTDRGYFVLSATTPGEALSLARGHAGVIDLLLTDIVMPEMNGRDLAAGVQALYPGIKRLFMSGYTREVIAYNGVIEDGMHFLEKPFTGSELAAKVRETLEG